MSQWRALILIPLMLLQGCASPDNAGRAGAPLDATLVVHHFNGGDSEILLNPTETCQVLAMLKGGDLKPRTRSCLPPGMPFRLDVYRNGELKNVYFPDDGGVIYGTRLSRSKTIRLAEVLWASVSRAEGNAKAQPAGPASVSQSGFNSNNH